MSVTNPAGPRFSSQSHKLAASETMVGVVPFGWSARGWSSGMAALEEGAGDDRKKVRRGGATSKSGIPLMDDGLIAGPFFRAGRNLPATPALGVRLPATHPPSPGRQDFGPPP